MTSLEQRWMRGNAYIFLLWLRRDLRARYAGSLAGTLWAVLLPLLTVALFYVIFALVLQVRIPALAGDRGYFFYLLAGLLPWLTISEGAARAAGVLVAEEQFLQKLVFPIWVLPGTVVAASVLPQLVGTLLFLILLAGSGLLNLVTLVWWPLVFLCQIAIQWGLGLSLAVIGVHVRDLIQVLPVLLQLLFYASPILYPKSLVAEDYHPLFLLNPFSGLVEAYQALFLGLPLAASSLASMLAWTLVLGGGGMLLYRAIKPTLGDYL